MTTPPQPTRRRVLEAGGLTAATVALAGCSFSYEGSQNRISTDRTFEVEAEEGDDLRVRIRGTERRGEDDGVSAGRESADGTLTGPGGDTLVELSFRGDGASDEATLIAPATGTYEFYVDSAPDTVYAYFEVNGEEQLD